MATPFIRFKPKEVSSGCNDATAVSAATASSSLLPSVFAQLRCMKRCRIFPFLSLPGELRDIVYKFLAQEYAIQSRQALTPLPPDHWYRWPPRPPRPHRGLDSIVPPIMQVCHQLHHEFLKHYMASEGSIGNLQNALGSARGTINIGHLLITNVVYLRMDLPMTVWRLHSGSDYYMAPAILRVKYDACQTDQYQVTAGPYLRLWLDDLQELYLGRVAITVIATHLRGWTRHGDFDAGRVADIVYRIQDLGTELGFYDHQSLSGSVRFLANTVQLRRWDQELYIWLARFEAGTGAVQSGPFSEISGFISSATPIND